jgi:internalin A
MDHGMILEIIERAAADDTTLLDLSRNQLTYLPPEITELTNLTSLDLGGNQLTNLPLEITELTNLASLELNRNQLTNLPPEITELTNLTSLDLSRNQLTNLPPEIIGLTNLTRLRFNNNQLTNLPPEIAKLTNLEKLYLIGNQLANLSPEITKLTKLTTLDLSYNQLKYVPPEITKLANLTTLDLSYNQLKRMPPEITRLTSLILLDLSGNKLTNLPPEITELTNLISLDFRGNQLTNLLPEITKLTNLENLSLRRNQLTNLPPEIAKLTNLTRLDLRDNQLKRMPPEIIELTNLTSLHLSGNQLMNLPPEIAKLTNLKRLHLSGNHLTNLPPEIAKLTNLTSLDLRDNQLPFSPEILSNPDDVKPIFAALAGLLSGKRLNEAKILVVGDGKVGKSSVVERLIKGTFDPRKETTLGIEINDEIEISQFDVKCEGEQINLNIWDFGGQEIQHSTHQFFLTTRSLYLLVVDARKGDQIGGIEYWLKLIESFGGDSPIIVVINQIDQLKGQRPLNLDRKALQEKYNVKAFIETSCPDPPIGIEELKAKIAGEVEQLKHVRDFWPQEWLNIKHQLKSMKEDYIPVEKYLEICREEKLEDASLRESLLGLLHDLGVVICFPGEMQVLNPRWVTQGVYGLLTSAQLVKSLGQFDLKDVGEILDGISETRGRYAAHTHRRLIDVMMHFELCFEFTNYPGHYLIPRHLHDNELDIPWDDTGALMFQYHYVETLPDAIISRFIVRMSQYIQKQYYWKNGVFLQSGENRAKIKADLVDRKIFISVNGKEQTRRAFLAVIRSGFEEINSNFKIVIKRMIPLPDQPGVLVSYDELIIYENNHKQMYFVATPGVEKDYEVSLLLDGIEDARDRVKRLHDEQERRPVPKTSRKPKPTTHLQPPAQSPRAGLWSTGAFFLIASIILLAAWVVAAIVLSKYVSVTSAIVLSLVSIASLLAIGVFGNMVMVSLGIISPEIFSKTFSNIFQRIAALRIMNKPEGAIEGMKVEEKKPVSRKKAK